MRCAYSVIAGLALVLATSGAAKPDIMWGVNGHTITAYPGVTVPQQLDYVKDLGMRSYRVNISDEGGVDTLALLVDQAKKRHLDILPVVTPGMIDLEEDSAQELYEKARELVVSLASRFKDDIRVWELGNEMEVHAIIQPCELRDDGTQYPCEWGPAGGVDALDYYGPRWAKVSAVLKGMSDGLTEVDPKLRKAMGTAGWGHLGAFERMRQDGIDWDISVWHMYGEDPEWGFEKISEYGRPIWVTEFNNPYGSRNSEEEQAEGLVRTMARLEELEAKYGVEAAYVYELMDEPYWAPSYEAYMGLVRLNPTNGGGWQPGEPKPAYLSVRHYIRGSLPLSYPRRECSLAHQDPAASQSKRQADFAYCLLLGQKGGRENIERWAAAIESGGTSIVDMMISLFHAEEFTERYGTFALTDRAYVAFLYRLLLNRDADGGGLESYTSQLGTGAMSREAIAIGMLTSSEFRDKHLTPFEARENGTQGSAAPPG